MTDDIFMIQPDVPEHIETIEIDGDSVPDITQVQLNADGDGLAGVIPTEMNVDGNGVSDIAEIQVNANGDGAADIFAVQATDIGQVMLSSSDHADNVWGSVGAEPVEMHEDFLAAMGTYDDSPFAGYDEFNVTHGTPDEYMAAWEQQESPYSCAVASTAIALRSMGLPIDESALAPMMEAMNVYNPGQGTSPGVLDDAINIIANSNHLPIKAEEVHNFTMENIEEMIDQGIRPIVSVDAGILYPGSPHTGHAVVPTDVRETDHGVVVVIQDPGHPHGAGYEVPVDQFMEASAPFNNYAVAIAPSSSPGGGDVTAGTDNHGMVGALAEPVYQDVFHQQVDAHGLPVPPWQKLK